MLPVSHADSADFVATAALPTALHRLRDETLDTANLAGYNLYLTAGAHGLRVGVADVRRNKFVVLEDYAPEPATSLAGQLQALASHHDLVGRPGWNRVRLAVQNRNFTLLPAPLFRDGDEAAYLRLHHQLDPQHEVVRRFLHPNREVVSVFSIEKALAEWFERTYPQQKLLHQTSALLEGVVHQSERQGPPRLFLSVGPHELTIAVVREKRPLFCNVFNFSTPEDFIYYVILVMQELGLNPDDDPVAVYGDLMHDSELFSVLRKYIRNVRFGNRPYDLSYSYRLNDVFEYRYFELYSLHLCE
ncbi:hypothetical protein ASU33_09520 [Solirubrum puertoriconensis]|uniref:DUF3822 family protein n=1 Tax=Solirubrum puertoriconensis TaxID=1751427 RepID=A0A9X0HLY9_SOLP1|nr:hypothetical protein ASU33_09520 [Solirubrum puertoriconensis]